MKLPYGDEHGFFDPEQAATHAVLVQGGYSTPPREAYRMLADGGVAADRARAWLIQHGLDPHDRRGGEVMPWPLPPHMVTPDDFAPGVIIEVPAGYRSRSFCLRIIKRLSVSGETGAVTVQGHVLSLNGTTTRKKPLLRTLVVMPGQVTIFSRPDSAEVVATANPMNLAETDNGYGELDRRLADALRAAATRAEADQIAREDGMEDADDAVQWLRERADSPDRGRFDGIPGLVWYAKVTKTPGSALKAGDWLDTLDHRGARMIYAVADGENGVRTVWFSGGGDDCETVRVDVEYDVVDPNSQVAPDGSPL